MYRRLDTILANEFGGRRGAARSLVCGALSALGRYARFERVDTGRVRRAVFVCKGNICRSPYAEYRLRALGGLTASAGLEADPGNSAHSTAQNVALQRNIDLAAHRSRSIRDLQLSEEDLLVAFEPDHARLLVEVAEQARGAQVTLLGLWSRSPWRVHIRDPYGLSREYFESCFALVDSAVTRLVEVFPHLRSAGEREP